MYFAFFRAYYLLKTKGSCGILKKTEREGLGVILTVDIGNTNTVIGGFFDGELKFVARISTDAAKTADEYAEKFTGVLSLHGLDKSSVTGAAISSVVPVLNTVIRDAIKFVYGVDAVLVGPGVKTGISIRCDNPTSVGSDIICACVAAKHLYRVPCLIVDMGSATKMTVLDKNGAFVGVSIIPGILMGLAALSKNTAQLPQISLSSPPSVIGKNTVDSMKSGVIFGNASLIDGMIDRICEEAGEELPVYVTGGLAGHVTPHLKHEVTFEEHMVLRGLYLIYGKNK